VPHNNLVTSRSTCTYYLYIYTTSLKKWRPGGEGGVANKNIDIMAWKRFVVDWNSTLNRAPQNVVSTFLFTQSSTWLLLFKSLSASSLAASLPPELAVGWLAARLTKKFRQPVNVALGAAVVQVAPSVADLKVTPLLTGAVSSPELATQVSEKRAQLEKAFPFLKPGIAGAVSAGQWLQGPVDKYGLALYLSG